MSIQMSIPKFRSTRRLLMWLANNYQKDRLPRENERCFFDNKNEDVTRRALAAVNYASTVGPLDNDFEVLISNCNSAITRYAIVLASWPTEKGGNRALPVEMEKRLVGDDKNIFEYATLRKNYTRVYGEARLPEYLEESLKDPDFLFKYARDVLKTRLPKHIEEKIFVRKDSFDPYSANYKIQNVFARYAEVFGPITEYEYIFENCVGNDSLMTYMRVLSAHKKDPSKELLSYLKGDNKNLIAYARMTGKRLPSELEDTLSDPKTCLDYAKEVIKGRLPEHLEEVFLKDYILAAAYAFDVIRGFASVQLPEKLHTMMISQSFASPNDWNVKRYVSACS